jgi:hypothetical protein
MIAGIELTTVADASERYRCFERLHVENREPTLNTPPFLIGVNRRESAVS